MKILITGLSGTGKTAVLSRLQILGFDTVETDLGSWKRWDEGAQDWLWDEARMGHLLAAPRSKPLAVSGCVPNQGQFYQAFDRVILLTAPLAVMRGRILMRLDNPFGQSAAEWARIEQDAELTLPLLRKGCDLEIDTDQPLDAVVQRVMEAAGFGGRPD